MRDTTNRYIGTQTDLTSRFATGRVEHALVTGFSLASESYRLDGSSELRDYINATGGFQPVSAATGTPEKSLMRMFGPRGNPQATNLFAVIAHLQAAAGVRLEVTSGAAAA